MDINTFSLLSYLPKANVTNTVTNILQALACFIMIAFSIFYSLRNKFNQGKADHDKYFTFGSVTFFIAAALYPIPGIYMHYYTGSAAQNGTMALSLMVPLYGYTITRNMKSPSWLGYWLLLLTLLGTFAVYVSNGNFVFISFPIFVASVVGAYLSKGLLRKGFIMLIVGNIVWMALRQAINHMLGHELPVEYRYDNDLYHAFIIYGVWLLYRGIYNGDFPEREKDN
jgi:predicted membrane channel-forming protein YqfA (hemolysin III family)